MVKYKSFLASSLAYLSDVDLPKFVGVCHCQHFAGRNVRRQGCVGRGGGGGDGGLATESTNVQGGPCGSGTAAQPPVLFCFNCFAIL